jgi:hypothetical protein
LFYEPAYVDSCFNEECGSTRNLCQSDLVPSEPRKIPVEPTHLPSFAHQESYLPDLGEMLIASGEMMKASAALQLSPFLAPQPYVPQQSQRDYRKRRTKRRSVLLIATQLNELQAEDPNKIVIVRKINRLGFDSSNILKTHFGQFGHVEKVLLSNAHTKQPGVSYQIRLRPSGIAFVVFESAEAAAQVLAQGEVHTICGLEVWVRAFERRQFDDEEEAIENEALEQDVEETNSIATASTRCSIDSHCDRESHEDEEA